MNGMQSLFFISVLMNASEVATMESKRNSPKTAKAASSRKSRGARAIVQVVDRSKPTQQEFKRWKALIQAIKDCDLDVVSELLDKKKDLRYINYWDIEFNTPLLCAIFMSNQGDDKQKKSNYKIVQKLLENKADVNPWYNSPMQVAQLMENHNIIRLLSKYNGRIHVSKGEERTTNNQAWQCECDACTYKLQDEHKKDQSLQSEGILKADFGSTPEEAAEYDRKKEEEKQKRILAKRAQNQSIMIRDQRGYYREIDDPTQAFDSLMKHH
jgi:hypothetical protein